MDIPKSTTIECPECRTRYELPVVIPEGGRKVRCSKCAFVWLAKPAPISEPEPAPEEDDDIIIRTRESEDDGASPDSRTMEEPAAGDSATPDTAPGNDAASGSSGSAQPKAEREPIVSEIYESEEEARGAPLQDEEMSGGLDIDSAAAEFDELTNTPEASARADIIVRKRRRGTGLVGIAVGWALLLIGLGALGYFGVTERAQVVQALPGSAWVYERLGLPVNVRGLEFRKLAYGWTAVAGRQMLEVSGEVVNVSDRPRKVPSIEFALRDAQNTEIYQWTEDLRAETVPVGGVFPFKASIDSPPKGAANLQVRFARGS